MRISKSFVKTLFTTTIIGFLLTSCNGATNYQFSSGTTPQKNKLEKPLNPTNQQPYQPSTLVVKKKVKVAALLPLSGKNKDLGTSILNSVVLSLFDNDKQNDIELVIVDSKENADDTKKAIENIAAQNIKIVIGPIFSSDIQAISQVVDKNKMTVLSFSNNQDLSKKTGVFLMGYLPEQQIERMVSYSISSGKDNIAIIAPNNQYGLKFAEILKEMVGRKDGSFIDSQLYTNSNKDLERTVYKVLNANIIPERLKNANSKNIKPEDRIYANSIFIPESGKTLSKIVSLIKKLNTAERSIQIMGSSNWDDISTLNDPNLIGEWFVGANPTKYRDFEKRYYQTYNKFPPRISSIGYDASLAIIQTIRNSNKRDLIPEDFINYQSAQNGFDGMDGLFRFLPNGIVQRNFAILEVGNGRFEMVDSPNTMFFKY
jgi:ABC-type branched-subunit amino acid transport system substrate-binding protein